MAKEPNWNEPVLNVKRAADAIADMKENTRATVINVQIKVGQTISFWTPEGEEYFTKIAWDEYVDAKLGERMRSRNISEKIIGNRWRVVDRREMLGKLDAMGFLKKNIKRHIEMDFETTLGFNKYNPDLKHLINMGWVEKNTLTGGVESKTKVIMHDFLRKNMYIEQPGNIEGLKWNIFDGKTAEQEFINTFTKKHGVSQGVARSYANVLRYLKEKVPSMSPEKQDALLRVVQEGKGFVDFEMKPGEHTVLTTTSGIGPYMRKIAREQGWERQIAAGEQRLSSFNPGGIDQVLLNELLRQEGRLGKVPVNIADSRQINLMLRSMQFPQTGMEFYITNDALLRPIMDRLGVSGKIRDDVVDNIIRGASSGRAKGSDLQSFLNVMRDYEGLPPEREVHEALADAMLSADVLSWNKRLAETLTKSIHEPGRAISPHIQSRVSYIKQLLWRSLENTPAGKMFMNERGVSDPAGFYKFFDKQTNLQEIKNTIERMTQDAAERKYGGTLLKDTRTQFGPGNIQRLLMGAMGSGLLVWGINRFRARMAERDRHDPEGLSHNSIPTIIRRLQMTDFGSGRVPSNWTTAAMAFVRSVFTESRQRGLGKSVSGLISGINEYIKNGLRRGDVAVMDDAANRIWGESRLIGNKFHKLIFGESKIGQSVKESIERVVKRSSSVVTKVKNFNLNQFSVREISKSVVDKWHDIPTATKLIVGGGLGVGVAGAMLINTMKGDYDPNYDYRDYIDKGQRTPRNYTRNLREIRSVRHLRNLQGTMLSDQESDYRSRMRRMHSDFGSKVLPLLERVGRRASIMTSKYVRDIGQVRKSLRIAFNQVTGGVVSMRDKEVIVPTRVFKQPATAKVMQSVRKPVKLNKLGAAVDKVTSSAMKVEGMQMGDDIERLVNAPVTEKPALFRKLVKPSYTGNITHKALQSRGRIEGGVSSSLVRGDKITQRIPSQPMFPAKIAGEFSDSYAYDTMKVTYKDRFAKSLHYGGPKKVGDIALPKNVAKNPKYASDTLGHAVKKAEYTASRPNIMNIQSTINENVSVNIAKGGRKDPVARAAAAMGDDMWASGGDAVSTKLLPKGDVANLNKMITAKEVPQAGRWVTTTHRGGRLTTGTMSDYLKNDVSSKVNQLTIDRHHYFGKRYYGASLPPYSMHTIQSTRPSSLFTA